MVAQHVHHADGREADGVEVRTLHLAGADQQTAVRTAADRQLVRRGVFLGDEVFGRRDEVVEDVLLVFQHAGLVPRLAVLRTAAQVGFAVDAALLDEEDRRRGESGGDVDLETAVGIEQAGILAVAFQPLAVGDEHRDPGAVLRRVKHLLGRELRGIEFHLRGLVERRCPRGDVVFVDGRGRRVVGQRIVELRILPLAAEAADRTDGGQLDRAHQLAVVVVLTDPVLRILQVVGEQVTAGRADPFEQVFPIFGNHRRNLGGSVQLDAFERVVRGALIGDEEQRVVLAIDGHVIGVEAREQRAEFRFRDFLIKNLVPRRALGTHDEEPLAVVGRHGREVAQRVRLVLVDEFVGRLGRTQFVVVNFLEFVLGRVGALFRRVVGAVIESLGIGSPPGARELHPLDPVGGERLVGGVHHADLHPVGTRRGGRIGEPASVLRERHGGQRHRSVVGERVGVEEHLARGARLLRAPDHRLVLQTVVIGIVPPVAVLRGSPLLGIVPQLGQPLADRPAERNLREIVLGHGVLGGDPGGRRFGIVVFEPPVGIGNLGTEIVVHHVAALGFGVRQVFDLFHVAATCRHRRCTEQDGGFVGKTRHNRTVWVMIGTKLGKNQETTHFPDSL